MRLGLVSGWLCGVHIALVGGWRGCGWLCGVHIALVGWGVLAVTRNGSAASFVVAITQGVGGLAPVTLHPARTCQDTRPRNPGMVTQRTYHKIRARAREIPGRQPPTP